MSKTLNAINQEIAEYINEFKMNMLIQLNELPKTVTTNDMERIQQFVCNYKVLSIVDKSISTTRDDGATTTTTVANVSKRPRRKKSEMTNVALSNNKQTRKMFYIKTIRGINYFVDEDDNVYKTESILNDNLEPCVLCALSEL